MSNNVENQISPADSSAKTETEKYDNIPSANTSERDSGNNKKLKTMGLIVLGILVMLIGIGIAVGRFGENRQQAKAEEAERLAQEQKKIAEGSTVNIAKDQEAIAANQMYDLPTPAGAEGAEGVPGQDMQQEPIVVQQQTPIAQQQPQYNNYQEPDYSRYEQQQAPVQLQPQPQMNASVSSLADDINDVLVDVYGAAKVSATGSNANQETGLASQFKASNLLAGKASKKGDVTMLLSKGTTLPCVLKTKIDSTYKGFTTCQISKDVYSANGRVLLLERGSTVFGEQNVDIKQGQARVAVLWSRIETPKGVSVDIDSPAAGQLGEMGIDAKVKNHFWKRFGGAIMLSLVKDVSANVSTQLAKDGQSQDTANNTTSAAESMAEKALENTINIPPTATVNHGKLIQILVVRDIDFGGIYELRKH